MMLFFAASLEVLGDALIRSALHASAVRRIMLFAIGAVVLFAYGCAVNAPKWEFGRLLGAYVVFFFVVAQVISYVTFGHKPDLSILLGGGLIVVGGVVLALGSPSH